MKKRILVIGSSNMDLVANVSRMPESGETLLETGKRYRYAPGGKGANAAIAAERLGGDCVFCSSLGDDLNGSILRKLYEREQIDIRFVSTSERAATGHALILVEPDGANRIIVYPGANLEITKDAVEEAMLCYPDAVLMPLELDPEVAIYAAQLARVKDVPVFVDAGPADESFPLERFPRLKVFSPNETETEKYTGILPSNPENCLRACIALSERVEADYYVLKLGDRGCYVYDGKYYHCVPSYDAEAVDTTAAGDVFTAALTLRYLESDSIEEAADFANAAGALAVSQRGSSTSAPTREAVDKLRKK